jgi:rhodanese-related sulfurtransferase
MAVPRISREELKARLDSPDSSSHPLIIDVRLKYPYEHSTVTLPGAQRILPDAIPSATLPNDREIVLFDSDPDDMVAVEAGAALVRRGLRAMVLKGGINEWMTAKLPVDSKSAPQPAAPAAKPAAAARPAGAPGAATAKPPTPAQSGAKPPTAPENTAPPAAGSAEAAAPKSAGPASVEGPATPATESKP